MVHHKRREIQYSLRERNGRFVLRNATMAQITRHFESNPFIKECSASVPVEKDKTEITVEYIDGRIVPYYITY